MYRLMELYGRTYIVVTQTDEMVWNDAWTNGMVWKDLQTNETVQKDMQTDKTI